tara:strand:+ start:379 stop:882 length:504 start_codon:yes stop_codon:yes gene_type:complete
MYICFEGSSFRSRDKAQETDRTERLVTNLVASDLNSSVLSLKITDRKQLLTSFGDPSEVNSNTPSSPASHQSSSPGTAALSEGAVIPIGEGEAPGEENDDDENPTTDDDFSAYTTTTPSEGGEGECRGDSTPPSASKEDKSVLISSKEEGTGRTETSPGRTGRLCLF